MVSLIVYKLYTKLRATFLAGFPPVDLLAAKRYRIRQQLEDPEPRPKVEIKSSKREITINQWQVTWTRDGER